MRDGDGAHLGVTAERALQTILGGKEQPAESERRSPEEMRHMLAHKDDNVDGYDLHAQVMAKYLVCLYETKPELSFLTEMKMGRIAEAFYADEAHPFRLALSEATGFSWGWAINVARYALHLEPLRNPAIMTIQDKP